MDICEAGTPNSRHECLPLSLATTCTSLVPSSNRSRSSRCPWYSQDNTTRYGSVKTYPILNNTQSLTRSYSHKASCLASARDWCTSRALRSSHITSSVGEQPWWPSFALALHLVVSQIPSCWTNCWMAPLDSRRACESVGRLSLCCCSCHAFSYELGIVLWGRRQPRSDSGKRRRTVLWRCLRF